MCWSVVPVAARSARRRTPPEHRAGPGAGVGALLDHDRAVYNRVADATGALDVAGLAGWEVVDHLLRADIDGRRVEDHQVGVGAQADLAAVAQPIERGGQTGEAADRAFEGQNLPLADPVAQAIGALAGDT